MRLYILTFLEHPLRPYLIYGITLIIIGLSLTFFIIKNIVLNVKWRSRPKYQSRELLFIFISIAPIPIMIISLNQFIPNIISGENIQLFILFGCSTISLGTSYYTTGLLKNEKLLTYSWIILALSFVWSLFSNLNISTASYQLLNQLNLNDPNEVYVSQYWLARLESVFFQIELFIILIHIFYVFLAAYENIRSQEQIAVLLEKETKKEPFSPVKRKLETLINKKDLNNFFNQLSEVDIEASSIFFCILKESLHENKTFTYNIIVNSFHKFFSKNIYERKPVERILKPLNLVTMTGGKIKYFRLNTHNPYVKKLLDLFKQFENDTEKIHQLMEYAGLNKLKERKEKFTSSVKEKNSNT